MPTSLAPDLASQAWNPLILSESCESVRSPRHSIVNPHHSSVKKSASGRLPGTLLASGPTWVFPRGGHGLAAARDNQPMSGSLTLPRLTVYFDGSCPLCRREIAFYRRMEAAQRLAWIDVSRSIELGEGLDCRSAMARFHVRDVHGTLHSGAQAFALLWRELPGWRWLGYLVSLPWLSTLAEWAYRGFLPLRPWLQRTLVRLRRGRAGRGSG